MSAPFKRGVSLDVTSCHANILWSKSDLTRPSPLVVMMAWLVCLPHVFSSIVLPPPGKRRLAAFMALIYDRLGTASQAVKPSNSVTCRFFHFFAMRFVWCDIINKYLVISDVWFWNWDFYFGNVKKTSLKNFIFYLLR